MGVVHKARDPAIDRVVAIKVLRLGFSRDDADRRTFIERFRREAKIAGKLSHPHIVGVYDVGSTEDDAPYLVMELFPGVSLSQLLERDPRDDGGLRDVEEIRLIVHQLASALAYAHAEGVVHRDVKPANVLYQPGPRIKLVDFGIAKIEALELTATGELIGTPSYMSPEIFAGDPVDGRSDLFSLGVILYQLLTGRRPFEAESVSRTIFRVLHDEPVAPSKLRKGLPPAWDHLCARLLAKDPARRYPKAEALIEDLDAVGRGEPLRSLPAEEPTEPIRVNRPSRRRALFLLLLALAIAAAAAVWRIGEPEAPPPAPSVEELLVHAERSIERGDLDGAGSLLNAVGAHAPELPGLDAARERLDRARFEQELPLTFVARHEHRIGHCTGDLFLDKDGIRFHSSRHGRWRFDAGQIEALRHPRADALAFRAGPEEYTLTFLRPALDEKTFDRYRETLVSARRTAARASE